MVDGGSSGLLIVITGASHVVYGSRGTGLPVRVQKKLTKRTHLNDSGYEEKAMFRRRISCGILQRGHATGIALTELRLRV
jgi:hypothetical protein